MTWIFIFVSLLLFVSLTIKLPDQKKPIDLISPFLKNEKILGINQWFPKYEETYGNTVEIDGNKLQITAKAALFVDSKTGDVLYSKNAKDKLPIASLAKVMTALIALEHKSLNDNFLVSQRTTEMEPDEMILIAGEHLTLRELLYGIFMVSANDAAEVLAEGTLRPFDKLRAQGEPGNRDEFIRLMNAKAKQLGMKDTYFVNPTGLDEDSNNSYSTAYDMAILTRYLTRHFPEVVEISKTPYIFIPENKDHQSYEMWTGINLLTTYPGVVGFKTGYTPEAGLVLITLARKDGSPRSAQSDARGADGAGHEVIGVLLNSEYRRDEAKLLLDYSFKKLIQ
ncbi:MAG: D-alanyl-D-alanine carboxypeptidase family protein [Patescibacteria group bacterium]